MTFLICFDVCPISKHVFYCDPFHQDLKQAFHMQENLDKYFKYLIGGVSAGTIVAFGTIAPGGTFQYLYAPQVHHDLGGNPIGFVGNSSNKIGEFSCVYISLSDFKYFPFVEATTSMNELLKHTEVTQLASAHLTYTRDFRLQGSH